MASPITSTTGLGSGLAITAIVQGLVGAEKAPKQNQIDKQTATTSASLSGVSQLTSALAAFQKTLDTLGSSTTPAFQGFAATSANEAVVKATAGNTAVNGTYAIGITQLATPSKVATAAMNSASAIPSGTLKITQNGTDYDVKIDNTSTLTEVRDKINSTLQGKGITANIINDNNGSRLVFSSTTTGAGSDISVVGGSGQEALNIDGTKLMSATSTGNDANGKPIGGAGAITAIAGDAEFTVDGLSLTSKTNTVSTAISGLTFELVAPSASSAASASTTVTVATNTDGLKTSLQSFVDSYNTLVTLVSSLTKGTTDSEGNYKAAALTGDSTPRGLLATIRDQISTATSNAGLSSLAQLGIKTQQAYGKLSLNTAELTTALSDKKLGSQIQAMFTGTTKADGTNNSDGLISRMNKALLPYTKADGVLATKTTSLNKIQARTASDQEALNRRIESLTATLTKKYNAMDLVVGQLKATASSITSIFEAMNAQKNAS